MTTKKTIFILIGIVLVAFGIGFLALNFNGYEFGKYNGHGFSINFNPTASTINVDEKAVEDIGGVEKIYITAPIAKVNIIPENRKDVSIHYHGNIPDNIKTSLQTKKSKDELEIKVSSKNYNKININNNMELYLEILIPNSYNENMKIEANLGDIRIQDFTLNNLDINANLGNINAENVESKEIKINCDAGNVIVKNIKGDIEVNADLGNVELYYDYFDYDLIAKSSLGSINITLPKNANFNLDAKSDLGTVKTDFPVTTNEASNTKLKGTVGNGGKNIKLTVDLGSIKINSK